MRDLSAQNARAADVDWVVQGDRRLHLRRARRARARAVAAALARARRRAAATGSRCCSANNVEWVVMFWACAVARRGRRAARTRGGRPRSSSSALVDSGREGAVLRPEARGRSCATSSPALDELEHVFVIGPRRARRPARPFAELLAADDPGHAAGRAVDEDDLLAILYTSGTTGQPKGATHHAPPGARQPPEHHRAAASPRRCAATRRREADARAADRRTLLVVPLFHVTGCLVDDDAQLRDRREARADAAGQVRPRRGDGDRSSASRSRRSAACRRSCGASSSRRTFEQYDLSSVQPRRATAARPPRPSSSSASRRRSRTCARRSSTAYGLTETASVATVERRRRLLRAPRLGRAAPRRRSRSASSTTTAVDAPPGERGEVVDQGPDVMSRGYWRRPDANEASFSRRLVPHRRHRLPRRRRLPLPRRPGQGHDHPRRRERVLRRGRERAVRPSRRDRRRGRRRAAQARSAKRSRPSCSCGRARPRPTTTCARTAPTHLADFKVPEYVELRDEPLPRNPAGKVLKSVLRGDGARRVHAVAPTTRRSSARMQTLLRHPRSTRATSRSSLNALAGLYAARGVAVEALRGRPLWIADDRRRGDDDDPGAARHVLLVGDEDFEPPRFHMFYGFVVFITIGLLYRTGTSVKGRLRSCSYGLGGLFIMGLGHPRGPPGAGVSRAPAYARACSLFGGRSAEHDVSRVTAVAVARALDPERYEVVPVGDHDRGAVAARRRRHAS